MPLVSRTRATLRSAEFGFFGVCVKTRTHTPRFCGLFCSAGLFVLLTICFAAGADELTDSRHTTQQITALRAASEKVRLLRMLLQA